MGRYLLHAFPIVVIALVIFICCYPNLYVPRFSSSPNSRRFLQSTPVKVKLPFNVRILNKHRAELPQWLREYIDWHKLQRKYHLNDPSTKFLTVACHIHGFCGGIGDRLTSIPYLVEVANKTGRVFFIKWEKYNLEDFFQPVEGGLDWRLPDGIDIGSAPDAKSLEIREIVNDPKHPLHSKKNLVLRTNVPMHNDLNYRTEQRPTGKGSYYNIMHIMFVPTSPLMKEIVKTRRSLGLIRKQYVAAHYRVLADHHTEVNQKTIAETHRAIDCAYKASGQDKNIPIYFAASKSKFVKYILNDSPYAQSNKPAVKVVGLDNVQRIHSDKSFLGYGNPRDLYPAFIDLWMMKESLCVSHGHLGFGKFGSSLSGEDCVNSHISGIECPSAL